MSTIRNSNEKITNTYFKNISELIYIILLWKNLQVKKQVNIGGDRMTKKEYIEKYGEEEYQRFLEQQKQYQKQKREQHKEEYNEYYKEYMRKYNSMFAYCIPEEIEQIENYEMAKKDNFESWHIHHRLETHNSDGEKRLINLSVDELIAFEVYYNRPAKELIFLTASEHRKLHHNH